MKRFEVETIELKPCPFCGGKAGIYSLAKYEKEAYCENCGAVSNICMTKEEAVEAWNRRAERTRHDDDERREVARRLRGLDYSDLQESLICAYLEALGIEGYADWVGIAHRLADLIEPPTQCPYYHSDRHYCSAYDDVVDRDALLALADEMESDARVLGDDYGVAADVLRTRAAQLREAFGVHDG